MLATGGPRGVAYEPSPWDDFFAATRHRNAGEYDSYLAEFEEALERWPDHPAILYNVARAATLLEQDEAPLDHLRRALELRPEWVEIASEDDDFARLRDLPGWPV